MAARGHGPICGHGKPVKVCDGTLNLTASPIPSLGSMVHFFEGAWSWLNIHAHAHRIRTLIVAQNDAMKNRRYFASVDQSSGNLTTHCSEAALYIAKYVGTSAKGILANAHGQNFDANIQINKLADSKSGFRKVTPAEAQALANVGVLVFATQHGAGHGHIASVRPVNVPNDSPIGRTGPLLANIGKFNGVARESKVFSAKHGAIVYFAHGD